MDSLKYFLVLTIALQESLNITKIILILAEGPTDDLNDSAD